MCASGCSMSACALPSHHTGGGGGSGGFTPSSVFVVNRRLTGPSAAMEAAAAGPLEATLARLHELLDAPAPDGGAWPMHAPAGLSALSACARAQRAPAPSPRTSWWPLKCRSAWSDAASGAISTWSLTARWSTDCARRMRCRALCGRWCVPLAAVAHAFARGTHALSLPLSPCARRLFFAQVDLLPDEGGPLERLRRAFLKFECASVANNGASRAVPRCPSALTRVCAAATRVTSIGDALALCPGLQSAAVELDVSPAQVRSATAAAALAFAPAAHEVRTRADAVGAAPRRGRRNRWL